MQSFLIFDLWEQILGKRDAALTGILVLLDSWQQIPTLRLLSYYTSTKYL
jgi:hypothetical protein